MLRIANVMLSARRGGLEQSAVDWHHALQSKGHFVQSIGQANTWFANEIYNEYFVPFGTFSRFDPTATFRLARKLRFCDVAIFHGNRAIELGAKSTIPGRKLAVAHNFRVKPFVRDMDAANAVSPAVRRFLSARYPQLKTFELPNLVRPVHQPLDRPLGPVLRVGVIGRLHANKGFETAIEACALLARQGLAVELLIAGSGDERASLERSVADAGSGTNVRFLGWVEDKRSFFGEIDIFLLPSRTEPFGIVVLEAMTFGVPVIASAIDGPKDIITDGHDGLLVTDMSPAGFARAIDRLAGSEALRASIRANALATIDQRYSFDVVAQRMSDAVTEIAGGPAP